MSTILSFGASNKKFTFYLKSQNFYQIYQIDWHPDQKVKISVGRVRDVMTGN